MNKSAYFCSRAHHRLGPIEPVKFSVFPVFTDESQACMIVRLELALVEPSPSSATYFPLGYSVLTLKTRNFDLDFLVNRSFSSKMNTIFGIRMKNYVEWAYFESILKGRAYFKKSQMSFRVEFHDNDVRGFDTFWLSALFACHTPFKFVYDPPSQNLSPWA